MAKTAENVSRLFLLKQNSFENSFETVSKVFRNCFVSVLFQFHFNCADSLTHKLAETKKLYGIATAELAELYMVFRKNAKHILGIYRMAQIK